MRYSVGPGDPLDAIAEEASEIIKERMKFHRFGDGTPEWLAAGNQPPHRLMVKEIADLLVALEVAIDHEKINLNDICNDMQLSRAKLYNRFGIRSKGIQLLFGIAPTKGYYGL